MDHLMLLLLLLAAGVQAEGKPNLTEPDDDVRLVGGDSRCSGELEVKHQGQRRPVEGGDWTLKAAAVVCEHLDCGSAVSVGERRKSSERDVWRIRSHCLQSGSSLTECAWSSHSQSIQTVTCSDSVRLLNGTSECSGRLEVKSNQSWSSVCQADFDQQDAEVVCRELGCGPPRLLRGALYGDVEAPVGTKEFQCGGNESALLDCRSSGSAGNSCSPGEAVGLTCSEPVRLVGGDSRCSGTVEVKHLGEWRPVRGVGWSLKTAAVVCEHLDCGSAVSVGKRKESSERDVWWIYHYCVQPGSSLRDCVTLSWSSSSLQTVTCSDSVRLLNGTSVCSGRLEVKSNQSWSSVCQADFDQQDAEVVCRELGCGPPSLLRGALYGDVEAPVGTKEFQCGGNESALLDCRSSGSAGNSCSPGEAVGLTCSEPVRLVGGDSSCGGTVEVKHLGKWRPVEGGRWSLKTAAVVCEHLDCGSAVSVGQRKESSWRHTWWISPDCVPSGSSLRDCVTSSWFSSSLQTVTCSDSVRLLNGTSGCSGRLEVKSNQSWSSVCQADFDQQDAEVVCRELGCGPPRLLRGALYGDVEAPVGTKEFQCGGNESALLDCRSSEPVRLVGGDSRCGGTVEVKHLGEWKPVIGFDWSLKTAAVVCEHLDCGSAVSAGERVESSERDMWWISVDCAQSGSSLRDCVTPSSSSSFCQTVTCSDLLLQPNISASINRVSQDQQQGLQVPKGSSFTISCSIQPQYPGGSFQLTFTSSDEAHNLTQPAVNHSADFLFAAAEPAHQGSYSCVYHVYIFSHNFSSESGLLSVTVPGVQAEGKPNLTEPDDDVRLVGGDSRCSGELEVKHQEQRRPVEGDFWNLKAAAVVCEHPDCGSAVSVGERRKSSWRDVWRIRSHCLQSGSSLTECARSSHSQSIQTVTCSDSVRLLNGTSECSGRLEVKSNQSWSSVCQADFDQQDAEVVCRELGCGPPSLLQGALYGDVETPVGTKEFQCGEPVRLVGGNSSCGGTMEVKCLGEWRPVEVGKRKESSERDVWWIYPDCVQPGSSLRDCVTSSWFSSSLQTVTCSADVSEQKMMFVDDNQHGRVC
ncbi:scavenger receptor cysteine-rich type 1 protein M130-like [Pholidichthys leucotaenia]